MKQHFKVFFTATLIFIGCESFAQKGEKAQSIGNLANQENHISIENFPKGKPRNHLDGWGEMTVAVNEIPPGTDINWAIQAKIILKNRQIAK